MTQDYRAYFVKGGRITDRLDFECGDDETAKVRAKQLVDGHDVELWELGRLVAIFKQDE